MLFFVMMQADGTVFLISCAFWLFLFSKLPLFPGSGQLQFFSLHRQMLDYLHTLLNLFASAIHCPTAVTECAYEIL